MKKQLEQGVESLAQWNLKTVKDIVVAQMAFSRLATNFEDPIARKLAAQYLSKHPLKETLVRRFLRGSGVKQLWATISADPQKRNKLDVTALYKSSTPVNWEFSVSEN